MSRKKSTQRNKQPTMYSRYVVEKCLRYITFEDCEKYRVELRKRISRSNYRDYQYALTKADTLDRYEREANNVREKNETSFWVLYLKFVGFEHEKYSGDTLRRRPELLIHFTCRIEENSSMPEENALVAVMVKEHLVYGRVTYSKEDDDESMLSIGFYDAVNKLDAHKALFYLTIANRELIGISDGMFCVKLLMLERLYNIEVDTGFTIFKYLCDTSLTPTVPKYLLQNGRPQKPLFMPLTECQECALQHCLTSRISIVQGGPGTGKTYLAICLMKMLTEKEFNPILLITVKNRVLDSTLSKLLDHVNKRIVLRIGHRHSENEKIKSITTQSQTFRGNNRKRKRKNFAIKKNRLEIDKNADDSQNIFKEIEKHREVETLTKYIEELLQEAQPPKNTSQIRQLLRCAAELHDVDLEKQVVKSTGRKREESEPSNWPEERQCFECQKDSFIRKLDGQIGLDEELNISEIDISNLTEEELRSFYSKCGSQLLWMDFKSMEKVNFKHHRNCELMKDIQDERRAHAYRQYSVLGTTVDGAIIHRHAFSEANVTTVICEEAAQVTERALIAALPKTTDHLIMIGDTNQLPPFCENKDIESYNESLMKRLIDAKCAYTTLKEQFRMSTEISDLLSDLYPEAIPPQDTEGKPTLDKKIRECMKHALYWWQCGERSLNQNFSNTEEAKRACYLAEYLVCICHFAAKDVTILTGYKDQIALIVKTFEERKYMTLRRDEKLTTLQSQVRTIDSFQGDESDIVILSLVRKKNIGFMKESGRRCVALSRAKVALYIIGDSEGYGEHDDWRITIEKLQDNERMGTGITLLIKGKESTFCYADKLLDVLK